MNVFIINGGQTFAHSGGMFNNTLTGWTVEVMKEKGFAYRVTNINDAFDPMAEVENFKWADVIIYPDGFVKVVDIDELATAKEAGLLTDAMLKKALLTLNHLLQVIYDGGFEKLQEPLEKYT